MNIHKIQFYSPSHQELFLSAFAQSSWREQLDILRFFKERGLEPWALITVKTYPVLWSPVEQSILLASVKLPEEEARNHVENMGKTFQIYRASDPFWHLRA